MLSIVVNDTLDGINIMKKYPAFYSRMLVNEALRTAFLDTLELLEQSRAGQLPDYPGPDTINLDFLQRINCKPVTRPEKELNLTWRITAEQLQTKFSQAGFHPDQICCSADSFLDESPINILHCHLENSKSNLTLRLDARAVFVNPENLNFVAAIFPPAGIVSRFEAALVWGAYRHAVELNEFGLASFPSMQIKQIFNPTGQISHDLELCLVQTN